MPNIDHTSSIFGSLQLMENLLIAFVLKVSLEKHYCKYYSCLTIVILKYVQYTVNGILEREQPSFTCLLTCDPLTPPPVGGEFVAL